LESARGLENSPWSMKKGANKKGRLKKAAFFIILMAKLIYF
jgi:hypothetical protein